MDPSAIARHIAAELKQGDQTRHADFVIADGVTADCDEQLMLILLENLLGNAWKFTAQREVDKGTTISFSLGKP